MNYIIIGGDGQEYGPISETDVRQWIAEGRLNAQSRAKAEGGAEFRPLGKFPEFAALLPPPLRLEATPIPPVPPPPPPGAGTAPAPLPQPAGLSREEALRQVNGPAVGLLVTAIIGLLFAAFELLTVLGGHQLVLQQNLPDPEMQKLVNSISSVAGMIGESIALVIGVVILLGALKMKNLRSHSFALTAAILAMIPCSPCCLLGLPFGIWALTVISKQEIKAHFE